MLLSLAFFIKTAFLYSTVQAEAVGREGRLIHTNVHEDGALNLTARVDILGSNAIGEGERAWKQLKKQYRKGSNCTFGEENGDFPEISTTCPQYRDLVHLVQTQGDPFVAPDDLVQVGVAFEPYKILEIDLDVGVFSVAGRLVLTWRDPRLMYRGDLWFPNWNSAVDYVVMPSSAKGDRQPIWYPEVLPRRTTEGNWFENSNTFMRPRVYDQNFLKAKGFNVLWNRIVVLQSECQSWLSAFPFDV